MTTDLNPPRILGLCASLRAGRWADGSAELVQQIRALDSNDALRAFLKEQSLAHFENFVNAGRSDGLPFDEIYANLKKEVGKRGLSNSEVALSAGLWAAHDLGCEIDWVSLVEHFPPSGGPVKLDDLRARIEQADAIMLATPVYFGDRGSLASSLIELFREDPAFADAIREKVAVGVAVGAKRNGGQETTLIYQIVDLLNAGMMCVGNDSETTSQYGGTVLAGDVGTAWKDEYGLNTSMGAGRRIARVAWQMRKGAGTTVDGKLRVGFWILQDRDGYCADQVRKLAELGALEVFVGLVGTAVDALEQAAQALGVGQPSPRRSRRRSGCRAAAPRRRGRSARGGCARGRRVWCWARWGCAFHAG